MTDALTSYVSGGYFLTKPAVRDDASMSADLLPPTLISLSTCLTEAAFEFWWSAEKIESARAFGVADESFGELIGWYTERFGVSFGAPNVAFSVDVIHEFLDRFVDDPGEAMILGCGLAPDQARRLLEHPAPEDMGEYGVYEAIRRGGAMEPGGEVLGWEVASYEYGLEHSWLCGGHERDASDVLGVTPGWWGLLEREADAVAVAEYMNRDDVPSEPGTWFPWLVVRYPRRKQGEPV